jgi:hypothetical protein
MSFLVDIGVKRTSEDITVFVDRRENIIVVLK